MSIFDSYKARKSDIEDISRDEFIRRFVDRFKDPYFDQHRNVIHELAEIQYRTHKESRKSPVKVKAVSEFQDPDYELADDWLNAKRAIDSARRIHDDPNSPDRLLIISGADRNDRTCPGEVSKSRRLSKLAKATIEAEFPKTQVDFLDLSLVISEYGKTIHPCKGCVSTAMPLCHFPCSCYPNYSLGQTGDWMNEIYERWTAAHGIVIITPVYWYQAPSALKLMIDRLVCADGGNPDPSSTHGKDTEKAKALEAKGWDYPKHLEGRVFGCLVHGDAAGANELRNILNEWAQDYHLIPAGNAALLARYIGYYEPYYSSHEKLDKDESLQEEVKNIARSVLLTTREARAGRLQTFNPKLKDPRPK